jgi:hypothetical protein
MDDIQNQIENVANADADDTDGAPASSEYEDTDIEDDDEDEPPLCVVFDNKLAQFMLRCD